MQAKERDIQIKIKQKELKKIDEESKKQEAMRGLSYDDQSYSDISDDEVVAANNLWGLHPKRSKNSLNPFTEQGQDNDTEVRPWMKRQSREETK